MTVGLYPGEKIIVDTKKVLLPVFPTKSKGSSFKKTKTFDLRRKAEMCTAYKAVGRFGRTPKLPTISKAILRLTGG